MWPYSMAGLRRGELFTHNQGKAGFSLHWLSLSFFHSFSLSLSSLFTTFFNCLPGLTIHSFSSQLLQLSRPSLLIPTLNIFLCLSLSLSHSLLLPPSLARYCVALVLCSSLLVHLALDMVRSGRDA